MSLVVLNTSSQSREEKKLSAVWKQCGDQDRRVLIQNNLWVQMSMLIHQKTKACGLHVPFASSREQHVSSTFIILGHLNTTWQVWEDSQSNNSATQNKQFWTTDLRPTVAPSQSTPLDASCQVDWYRYSVSSEKCQQKSLLWAESVKKD